MEIFASRSSRENFHRRDLPDKINLHFNRRWNHSLEIFPTNEELLYAMVRVFTHHGISIQLIEGAMQNNTR